MPDSLTKTRIPYKDRLVTVSINVDGRYGKVCAECGVFEEYTEFSTHEVSGRHYLQSSCRVSSNLRMEKHKDENPIKARFWNIKSRATNLGLPFNLTMEDLTIPIYCPILGLKLEETRGKKRTDNTWSIDRIIPEKGYVKGNVVIVSWRANRLKNNATLEELEKIYKFYKGED